MIEGLAATLIVVATPVDTLANMTGGEATVPFEAAAGIEETNRVLAAIDDDTLGVLRRSSASAVGLLDDAALRAEGGLDAALPMSVTLAALDGDEPESAPSPSVKGKRAKSAPTLATPIPSSSVIFLSGLAAFALSRRRGTDDQR